VDRTFHTPCHAPTARSRGDTAHHLKMSRRLVWLSPLLPSEHRESTSTLPHAVTNTMIPAQIKHWKRSSVSVNLIHFSLFKLCQFTTEVISSHFTEKSKQAQFKSNLFQSHTIQFIVIQLYWMSPVSTPWVYQYMWNILGVHIFWHMRYTEIKRARGATESERERSIKMWENVARSNVDYLLLWQWVWILQAAGLFLNKAIFRTDLWMKILTVETNLLDSVSGSVNNLRLSA